MATRPKNTYVSQVFNFGVDKKLPLGFVDVVYNKDGSMAGFISDGKFYEPGDKVAKEKAAAEPRKQYSKSLEERIAKAEQEDKEVSKAKKFFEEQNRNTMSQKEATALGDIYDNYATSLKPQIDEYEFKLDFYARKIAKGDKLTGIEENEIKDISKKYSSLKKTYNEARIDAVDMYYGRKTEPETKAGKKIQAQEVKNPTNPVVKEQPVPEVKIPPKKDPSSSKPFAPSKPVVAAQLPNEPDTTVNPVTGQRIKVSDIKPAAEGTATPKPAVGPGINDINDTRTSEALNAAAAIDLAGTLFSHVPSLKNLLDQYVKKGWTNARFLQELRDDTWYKKNSKEIKQRYVQLYNYQDLVASGQADGTTDYEKQIATLERQLADKARKIGSNAASDPAALRRAAENMYITNVGIDDAMTTDFLAAAIKPIAGMIGGKVTQGYSGEALDNYQALVKTARDNGFQVSDILPGGANEQQVLAGIASGKIDIARVQQDARKLAAQGQPQYVRDLLAQGYDLAQVFKPYRQVMGTVLEVNPDQIDLNDPLLRTAITDKGDMNLYDFKKALRQDNRWQYTEQAKADVSQAAYNVLKDFGFQG